MPKFPGVYAKPDRNVRLSNLDDWSNLTGQGFWIEIRGKDFADVREAIKLLYVLNKVGKILQLKYIRVYRFINTAMLIKPR